MRAGARRAAAAVALACAAILMAGCVRILGVTVTQSPLSTVAIEVKVCAVNNASCPRGAIGFDMSTGIGQVLLGFRVPAATVEPESFASTEPAGVVEFAKSATLSAELERLAPAGPGRRWVGYLSNPVNYNAGSGPQEFTATARFTLLQGPDGGPFVRPFRYRVVAGSRMSEPQSPSRPVACESALGSASGDASTVCVNSPPAADVATDLGFASRDAGVLAAGAQATAVPGALAAVPFTIKYSGPGGDEAPRLIVTASTTLPGAQATATPNEAIPAADGSVKALATVQVPADAAPGTYEVRLAVAPPAVKLTLPGFVALQTTPNPRGRVGVGQLTVQPPPAGGGGGGGGPAATLALSKATVKVAFAGSRPKGFLQIAGSISRTSDLNILVQRRSKVPSVWREPAVSTSAFLVRRQEAGPFQVRIPAPAGLVPGTYRIRVAPLTVDGLALPQRSLVVKILPPPEGVVDSAYISTRKAAGPRVGRFTTRPRTIFANFRFLAGALPKKGAKFKPTIQWRRDGRPIGPPLARRRSRSISTFLRLSGTATLPDGEYRAVLKVGKRVVAVAQTSIA